ncbi:hypothetical protein [Siccibacter turicensis]|uniref:hypothetical protein n=1 Tax=Siccibacter turicensis TaxID=357233 RepID=UPI0004671C32|nr:hypothetical protein [Siccibacter turicensis]
MQNTRLNALFLTFLMFISPLTWSQNSTISIRTIFDVNSAFCAIKTNGVLNSSNRSAALAGSGHGTSSTNSMLALENGENDITLEFGALDWFSDGTDKGRFHPDSSCTLSLVQIKDGKATQLDNIKVTINKDMTPYVSESGNDQGRISINAEKIKAYQVVEGHFPEDYFNKDYFPVNMELYRFTKKIVLQGLPEWKWVNATRFVANPAQIQALKQQYQDLWNDFASRNDGAIKAKLHESLHAWAITTKSEPDDVYNDFNFVDGFKNKNFKMIPINWNDYEIEVMNKGRLVRFINKSIPTYSLLTYYILDENGNERLRTYSPIFSLVDGRFIPVI